MKKILVACYSHSGHTKNLGQRISSAAGADLEVIEDKTVRKGAAGYLKSAVEAALHMQPQIKAVKYAPGDYDLVVIGTPIWLSNMASPVRSYISQHCKHVKEFAFFCTYSGSGQFNVMKNLTKLVGRPTVATLALTDKTIAADQFRKPLARLISQIRNTGIHTGFVRHRGRWAGAKDRLMSGGW
jgi:flavodoxin